MEEDVCDRKFAPLAFAKPRVYACCVWDFKGLKVLTKKKEISPPKYTWSVDSLVFAAVLQASKRSSVDSVYGRSLRHSPPGRTKDSCNLDRSKMSGGFFFEHIVEYFLPKSDTEKVATAEAKKAKSSDRKVAMKK